MFDFVNRNVCTIVQMYKMVSEKFYENNKIISQCDKETQDVLHRLEFDTHQNVINGYKLYDLLYEIRQRRRKAKNENEILHDLYHFCKDNPVFLEKAKRIQSDAQKIVDEQKERIYNPRTDIK